MQRRLWICFLFCLIILSCSGVEKHAERSTDADLNRPVPQKNTEFVLAAGDKIDVNVWRNSTLQRTVQLDPSGFISLPLAGEIKAEGMTIPQLRKKITTALQKYIKSPQVDVNIAAIASQKIYILGEVRNPGQLVADAPMTIWEALARAGGFTNNANKTNIIIVRQDNGKRKVMGLKMDLDNLYTSSRFHNERFLKNHDILYVPERKISTIEKLMNRLTNIIEPIISTERGIILGDSVKSIFQNKNSNKNITISP